MLGIPEGAVAPKTTASLKKHAKRVKKAQGIKLKEAQTKVAIHFGWSSFAHALSETK
ncbi:MAG: hypothetical protein AAFZ11_00870 [Pseudomonadota bacterium]